MVSGPASFTLAALACAVMLVCHAGVAVASPCTALNGQSLTLDGTAKTLSLSGQDVPAGTLGSNSPAFCAVAATVSSNGNASQSQIAIQVWLPETGWNGRFLGTGNGGFGGGIGSQPLKLGVLEGFAVANTDMGTGLLFQCNAAYCGSLAGFDQYGIPLGGLYGDEVAIADFGYGATHLMTLAGKQLVQYYYGQAANATYFQGCSTGGQQALMEAQRYPADYDGILAGSPAYDRTHLHSAGAAIYETTHASANAYLTDAALALSHAAVLSACAGTDGGLPSDDYLTRPALCRFDAAALHCTGAQGEMPCTNKKASQCSCLTRQQVVAMNQDWSGARDDRGRVLYPGFERSSEEPSADNSGLESQQNAKEPAYDSLEYWAFGTPFTWQSLFSTVTRPVGELSARLKALDDTKVGASTFAGVLNANSADLKAFNALGGKLILYAGYADPLIPSASSIDYYNTATADDAAAPSYIRLYMAPGMWHCGQGPGVNAFGNIDGNPPPTPLSPADDIMGAMIAWRETGALPGPITATHYVNNDRGQGKAFQRPLCPYPQDAAYSGSGDVTLAGSYVCVTDPPVTNQNFSPIYGPR